MGAHLRRTLACVLPCAALIATTATADTAEDFFRGKTVTYIVATGPGGGYDTYGRLIAAAMEKQVPGSKFVIKNVPGAGHIVGANQLYHSRGNGLTIGTFNTGLLYAQLVKQSAAKFDLARMSWIGKAGADPRVFVVGAWSDVRTLDDLIAMKEPHVMAEGGAGSSSFAESSLLIETLKIPLKIVVNYRGQEDKLAIQRREALAAMGGRSTFEPFVRNGQVRVLFQVGGSETDYPQLAELVRGNADAEAIAALIRATSEIGRLCAGPPDIPADRLAYLRGVFLKAMNDPETQARAAKIGRPLEPADGAEVERTIQAALQQPPALVGRIAALIGVPTE